VYQQGRPHGDQCPLSELRCNYEFKGIDHIDEKQT
jgi:hypothetical protein